MGDPGKDVGAPGLEPNQGERGVAVLAQGGDPGRQGVDDAAGVRLGQGDAHVAGQDTDPYLAADGDPGVAHPQAGPGAVDP